CARVVLRLDPQDHRPAPLARADRVGCGHVDPAVRELLYLAMHGAHAVVALHQDRALGLRQAPAVTRGDAPYTREVGSDQIHLRLARALGETRERLQVHVGLRERAEHLRALAAAAGHLEMAVAHLRNTVGHDGSSLY